MPEDSVEPTTCQKPSVAHDEDMSWYAGPASVAARPPGR
jgi:hypothetical protein